MGQTYLDANLFISAVREAADKLNEKRMDLNKINIFPVPDWDTGSNMFSTFASALLKAEENGGYLGEVSAAAWRGAQDGFAGNSGAIFAQYLKGWAAIFAGLERADATAVSHALSRGAQEAYSAVLKPAEGTMLTVAREAAVAAKKAAEGGELKDTLASAYWQARKALLKTGKALPELRNKKTVDAGGWGLLIFLRALLKVMDIPVKTEFDLKLRANYMERGGYRFDNPFDMEFFIAMEAEKESVLRLAIGEFGTDLITLCGGKRCHVHIHTKSPLSVAERAAELAEISDLTVRDMRSQYRDPEDKKRIVACGKAPGFIAMFAMAGADLALSISNLDRKMRLVREYAEGGLVISCKDTDLNGTVVLEDEAGVLDALVSLSGGKRQDEQTAREAAGIRRNASIVQLGYTFEAREGGETVAKGGLKETLAQAVRHLKPKDGEVLTLYYGRPGGRQEVEAFLPYLSEEFGGLAGIEVYFGGQEYTLVVSLE